jgi:hypothetical protein
MASLEDVTVSVSVDLDDATKALDAIAIVASPEGWNGNTAEERLAFVHRLAAEAIDGIRVSVADDRMADALAHERQRCAAILRKMYRHYDGHAIAEAIIEGKAP